jgi:hypothetical protein
MANKVGIKCIDDMYVVSKGKKFNIYVVVETSDNRKIGSSMYAKPKDVEILFHELLMSNREAQYFCTLSSGDISITLERVPLDIGVVDIYNVSMCNGNFVSKCSTRVLDEFKDSIKECYRQIAYNAPEYNKYHIKESKDDKSNFLSKLFNKNKKGIFE